MSNRYAERLINGQYRLFVLIKKILYVFNFRNKKFNAKYIVKRGHIWYKKWKSIFQSARISKCALINRALL